MKNIMKNKNIFNPIFLLFFSSLILSYIFYIKRIFSVVDKKMWTEFSLPLLITHIGIFFILGIYLILSIYQAYDLVTPNIIRTGIKIKFKIATYLVHVDNFLKNQILKLFPEVPHKLIKCVYYLNSRLTFKLFYRIIQFGVVGPRIIFTVCFFLEIVIFHQIHFSFIFLPFFICSLFIQYIIFTFRTLAEIELIAFANIIKLYERVSDKQIHPLVWSKLKVDVIRKAYVLNEGTVLDTLDNGSHFKIEIIDPTEYPFLDAEDVNYVINKGLSNMLFFGIVGGIMCNTSMKHLKIILYALYFIAWGFIINFGL